MVRWTGRTLLRGPVGLPYRKLDDVMRWKAAKKHRYSDWAVDANGRKGHRRLIEVASCDDVTPARQEIYRSWAKADAKREQEDAEERAENWQTLQHVGTILLVMFGAVMLIGALIGNTLEALAL